MASFNIAIDGPSGVGKSTIADILADKLDMRHLDTGAMYRGVAYFLNKANTDLNDEIALKNALDQIHMILDENNCLFVNGEDVSGKIRTNPISMFASKIAKLPQVRTKLVDLQQEITKNKGYIVDGRDICSVVLPDAEVKIYMDATSKARAQRRYLEYVNKGIEADYETIYQDIVARDYQDSHREISPLVKAEDAIELDTSDLTIDEVVEKALEIIHNVF